MNRGAKYIEETPEEFQPDRSKKKNVGGDQKKNPQKAKFDKSKIKQYSTGEKCGSCETYLGLKGGYCKTGLCAPCCTGDASTIDEFCETW